ncbi:MAG: methyltransferase domain-containing protein [Bdellovibrionota bacterium]
MPPIPALKEIAHALEIDEEGYPIFSGLRIHDEEVLVDIFSHLQRSQPELLRSKLITCLEGKNWAWINAFDAVLVAQSVQCTPEGIVELEFLGGLKETVKLEDFEIDEWNRFHAVVGSMAIPAVLSRKAQATLLNLIADRRELPNFARFRDPKAVKVSEKTFWSEVYASGQDGWELGAAHPVLATQEWQRFKGARVLVPGSGRGHEAAFLATSIPASQITALDIAPEALEAARARYGDLKNLVFENHDVFEFLKTQSDASWDLIFEHTFFCAIDPLKREEYVREVGRVLKPGGLWLGIFFLLEHPGGPPFAVTQWELREFTKKTFDIHAWKRIAENPSGRTYKELWAEFSRRSI